MTGISVELLPDAGAPQVGITVDGLAAGMQAWRDSAICDFHQKKTNPLLMRFWNTLDLPPGSRIFVPLKGLVDFTAEVARLDKELGKLDKQLAAIKGKLSAPGFANNAPADIVAAEREKLAGIEDARAKLAELQERLKGALAEG